MAYAKLSASLLACDDARPAPRLVQNVSAPSVFPVSAAAYTAKLAWHLKALKLPTFLREHDNLARQCAADGLDYSGYLLRLAELELIDRERRMVERRIKGARFPAVKSLDSFDLAAVAPLDKSFVLELARCEYVARRENIIVIGNSGTGKTHLALGLGLAACQKGLSVRFTTAASLVHELLETRDDQRLMRLQRRLAAYKVLIIDELGYDAALGRRRRAAVRGHQPTLRALLHDHCQQSSNRRVDQCIRHRAIDGRGARRADPPRPLPRNEQRELSRKRGKRRERH